MQGESLPTLGLPGFYFLALSLALLVGVAEVAAAYKGKPEPWRAISNRWAWPYYLLHIAFTFIMGMILIEQTVIAPSWTTATVLGLLGPALFKTQAKLFKPLAGSGGLNANLERIIDGVQQFCFEQINASLSHHRIAQKEQLATRPIEFLITRLQTLCGDDEYSKLTTLIDERREKAPDTVAAFLVELIEQQAPGSLAHTLRDSPSATSP